MYIIKEALPNAMDRGGRLHLFRTFVFRICI